DGVPDADTADLGFHAGAAPSTGVAPPPGPTPTPTPAPTPAPSPGTGTSFYVDCASGDDSRTRAQTVNPATPWRTIQTAASSLLFGEVAVVASGTCNESVQVNGAGITFRAQSPLTVTVAPPSGSVGFNLKNNDTTLDGFVIQSNQQGVLAA